MPVVLGFRSKWWRHTAGTNWDTKDEQQATHEMAKIAQSIRKIQKAQHNCVLSMTPKSITNRYDRRDCNVSRMTSGGSTKSIKRHQQSRAARPPANRLPTEAPGIPSMPGMDAPTGQPCYHLLPHWHSPFQFCQQRETNLNA